jgi:hypothetical protein
MDDNKAFKETAKLVTRILILCKEYADKDSLDFQYVVKTTAEAMLKATR